MSHLVFEPTKFEFLNLFRKLLIYLLLLFLKYKKMKSISSPLKLQNIILIFFVASYLSCASQSNYKVTAEVKSLMCPYLSPKFMSLLEKEGAKNMIKHEDYSITFQMDNEKSISEKRILELVDIVGYEPKLFKIFIYNDK